MAILHQSLLQWVTICCLLLAFSQGAHAVQRGRRAQVNATDTACPNECSGTGFCHQGTCLCKGGYSGEDCSVVDCSGKCVNGICQSDGSCSCFEGFSGDSCAIPSCDNNCNSNGLCSAGLCICFPGFSGERCENGAPKWDADEEVDENSCMNDCSGRGVCTEGICYCDTNFYGEDCSEVVCPDDCNGNGSCNIDTGSCVCDESHSGDACEFVICPYNCTGEENGICDTASGTCTCKETFEGFKGCNPAECLNDCNSANEQGTCLFGKGAEGKGICECAKGWEGDSCQIRQCDAVHTGPDCDIPRCPWDCNGVEHGICEEGFVCNCVAGWLGDACDLIECTTECLNNGTCDMTTGTCDCTLSPFGGESCSDPCNVPDCNQNGVCQSGTCFCHPGWSGDDCEVGTVSSSHKTAMPIVSCFNGVMMGNICSCQNGWTGVSCDVPIAAFL